MVDLTGSASARRNDVLLNAEYVVRASAERLVRLARMFDEGQLSVEIQTVIPFERATDALALVQSKRVRGKVVLRTEPITVVDPAASPQGG